jgi:hypothetical protein
MSYRSLSPEFIMRTPIALIIFNRPDLTERVFAEIARARPPKLLIIADGPRPEQPGETEKCLAARAVVDRVDWQCDVLKNYSEVNLGCGRRPATGLSWVFSQVEQAIILEDDCVAHPTFFRFCEELLEKYSDNERVMHISGDNFFCREKKIPFSYYFSSYCLSWGWATWRRAFRYFDPQIKLWPSLRDTSWLKENLGDLRAVEYWKSIFDRVYEQGGTKDIWDFQWLFAIWARRGLSILPNTNLVSNIGFREDATHTKRRTDRRATLPATEMVFPLRHPPQITPDRESDKILFERTILPPAPKSYDKLRHKCVTILPSPMRKLLSSLRSRLVEN